MNGISARHRRAPGPAPLAAAALLLATMLGSGTAAHAESIQPGFFYHDPSGIRLTAARSGASCIEDGNPTGVCEKAHRILITGEETCDYPPDKRYPCTWFGYEFDFQGATPGTSIECTVSRSDPRGRRTTDEYSHRLDKASGHIFKAGFRTYAPVEERVILAEVHQCAYQGELVSTVEFLIYYEPGTGIAAGDAPGDADPYFPETPNACSDPYLTERTAEGLLNAPSVRKHAASEHIPAFWSQCLYGATGGGRGSVGFVFKFMLSDMFDVDKLDRRQIIFHATFAQGNAPLKEVREDLGDLAFVFEQGNRTTLFVITGIKGPKDGANRSTEFTANYHIEHPDIGHEDRLAALVEQAKRHLREWGVE
ncbi:hypothetical protein [Lentisalinibacter sediminis]|uniref:hypothetical protein n=1 Tax=Lentisalinibacter sediminis TaxID=2992237 RepID=UPI00386D2B5A